MDIAGVSGNMEELHLDEVAQQLKGLFHEEAPTLNEIITNALSGNNADTAEQLLTCVKATLFSEIGDFKTIFVSVLLLGLLSAVFSELGRLFENRQIADMSYYLIYLMMIMVLLQVTEQGLEITTQILGDISDFSKILIPTYCLSIGLAGGSTTAIVFYEIALVIIFIIEKILVILIVPMIYTYVFLAAMNGIGTDGRMDGILNLLKKGIQTLLKLILTVISCFGMLQAMITPVIDSVKSNSIQKIVSIIPGIGGYINTATEVVYGSAVLVKNAVGVAGIVLLAVLCIPPLIQLAVLTLALKIAGAVAGIVADKRMNRCVEQVSEGSGMLFRTAATGMALFIITVAVVAVTTNRGF